MRTKQTASAFGACLVLAFWLSANAASADVFSLTLSPSLVYGSETSTGTVTIDTGLPRIRTVMLTSSNPQVASVPASLTMDAFRPGTFQCTTHPINTSTVVVITATEGGVSRQATITVRPPILTSVTFSPNPVCGGATATATVTLNRPAPANWLCSIQGPFPPIYFMTGSIVSFTPGTTSTTKQVNTMAVTSSVNALITVRPPTGQTPNVSAILTVNPPQPTQLLLTPTSVVAGGATLGCVELNCPAPVGGALVQLSSSDASVATVPATVQIDAGEFEGCFLVQSLDGTGCRSATISATLGGTISDATLTVGDTRQLTDDAVSASWSKRDSTTAGGAVLWSTGSDVMFFDGTSTTVIQPRGNLDLLADFAFGLGKGAAPGEWIAGWRRGTDFAWVWRSGHAPVLVQATNPFNPNQPLNPEAIAVADGAVFLALQGVSGGNASKHVFRVDPVTGVAVNLTGSAGVPGAARVYTAGGKAAWAWDNGAGTYELHFYDAGVVRVVDVSPTIQPNSLRLQRGRLVYQKQEAGVTHIFLYDSTVPGATPVRISPNTSISNGHFFPATDGWHVAWMSGAANGTNLTVSLLGGISLSNSDSTPANLSPGVDYAVQLQRGQALWKGADQALRHAARGAIDSLCIAPATEFDAPWLADGVVVGYSPVSGATETDTEVFVRPVAPPDDDELPPPPMKLIATADSARVTLNWDTMLGVSAYNVYVARQAGVNKSNYASLPGGRRISGNTASNCTIRGLTNGERYYFVVTAIENGAEGGNSHEISAVPQPTWQPISELAGIGFHAVATHETDGNVAYAAGNNTVYKTTDGGFTWVALSGAIAGRDTRALAVHGDFVYAVTTAGDVLRSTNGGANWSVAANGEGSGESNASIAIDPSQPQILYAGPVRLTAGAPTLVIRSLNAGDTWEQIPQTDIGEIHAYAMAIRDDGVLYAAGSGVPIARSADLGATWEDISPPVYGFYSLALDAIDGATLFAGGRDGGLYRSVDDGDSWLLMDVGLTLGTNEPVTAIVSDPRRAGHFELGTARGPFASYDGGATWNTHRAGIGDVWTYSMARTASGRLLAATQSGIFILDNGCAGDLNEDGGVGLQDLAILLGHFGTPSGAAASDGDLDDDADVDLQDLALLLTRFGTLCE